MKKIFVILLLSIVCSLCLVVGLSACGESDSINEGGESNSESGELEYFTDGERYMVSGIGTCTDANIIIPSVYNDLPVTAILRSAFSCCEFITSISIPDTITSIGDYAFYECSSLKSINITDSVTAIGYRVFNGTAYYNDESNWENNVLYAGNCLLEAKADITGSYTIKDGTVFIGIEAFDSCDMLESLTIPESVTEISDAAFCYCTSLESINVNSGNTVYKSIDGNLYNYDGTALLQYALGKADTSFTVPDGVTSIGRHSFRGCTTLTDVIITDSVNVIGDYSFCDCTALANIIIGSGVEKIGFSVYDGCTSLTSVTFENTNGWYVSQFEGTITLYGTSISVTEAARNAANLTDIYHNYYWFRSDK